MQFTGGLAIAAIGFVITAPWYLTVISRHGIDVYLNASGTHGGLISPTSTAAFFVIEGMFTSAWKALAIPGVIYAAVDRRWMLLGWAGAVALFTPHPPFILIPLAPAVALLVLRVIAPAIADTVPENMNWNIGRNIVVGIVVVALVSYGTFVATYYAAGSPAHHDVGPDGGQSVADHERAFSWVRENTAQNATALVVGPHQKFPIYANRTSILAPQGAEWLGNDVRQRHLRLAREARNCISAECFDGVVSRMDTKPDLLYLTQTNSAEAWGITQRTLNESTRWDGVYYDTNVVIYRNRA